jgi:hypothetical protein
MRPGVSFAVLSTILWVAGCVEPGSGSQTGIPQAAEASATADTGGISGDVVTDEFQPIGGAQVALHGQNVTTMSAEDGSFSFSDVPPGPQTILVGSLGYFSAQKQVEVSAGEIVKATIILDKIPVAPPPFEDVRRYEGDLTVSDTCNAGIYSPLPGTAERDYPVLINATSPLGLDMALTRFTADIKGVDAPLTIDIDMHFLDAEGTRIAAGTTAAPEEHIEINRVLAPGAYTLRVILCLGALAHYNLEVVMHYELGEAAAYAREKANKK